MPRTRGRFRNVAFPVLLCVSGVAGASQLTLTGDAHVTTARATTNFGTLSNLQVGNGSTTLLQFDTAPLPAGLAASQIAKATLTVFVNRIVTPGVLSVSPVTSAWTESAVTAATTPQLGSAVASLTPTQAGQFVTIDVTALVQGWVGSGSTNYGIALSSASGSLLLDSKENDQTSHAARLDVTVTSTGAVGPQGPAGAVGPAGPPGSTGAVGPAGPQGLTGAAGPAGPQGSTGAVGPAGPQGLTGAAGAPGATGLTGPQGTPGTNGAIGPVGPQGPIGLTGVQGATGAQGTPGLTGAQGLPGPAGSQGATGPAGAIGPQGANGIAGATGPQGLPGATGPQGLPGATGPQGLPGATGPVGATGAQGLAGAQGTAGGQVWSAAMTFPTEYPQDLYAPPTGVSTLTSSYQGILLPVPQSCTPSAYNVMIAGASSGSSATFSIRSYNLRDGLVFTGVACTVTAGTNGTGSCTSNVANTLFFTNVIGIGVSNISVRRAASDNVTATVSFVCR